MLRVGQGYDVHALVVGRPLIIGGVVLDYDKGLSGHSDADVLLHAITDALLGAAGLGDIGHHFSDTDPRWAKANSQVLLSIAKALLTQASWSVINIDATIITETPKLAQYLPQMCHNIALNLDIKPQMVNVKAKTNERLGYLGRSEAIEAQAICLINQI